VPVLDWLRALHRRDRRAYAACIARMMYEARTAAGLTPPALAARVGTQPAVLARLEEADVDRDALFLLHRIAAALGHALDMRLVPLPEPRPSA